MLLDLTDDEVLEVLSGLSCTINESCSDVEIVRVTALIAKIEGQRDGR